MCPNEIQAICVVSDYVEVLLTWLDMNIVSDIDVEWMSDIVSDIDVECMSDIVSDIDVEWMSDIVADIGVEWMSDIVSDIDKHTCTYIYTYQVYIPQAM